MSGTIAIYSTEGDIHGLLLEGVHYLRHRGEGTAFASIADGHSIRSYAIQQEVSWAQFEVPEHGHIGIGWVGSQTDEPVEIEIQSGKVVIALEGNILNADYIVGELSGTRIIPKGSLSLQAIALLLTANFRGDWESALHFLPRRLHGAYNLAILTPNSLVAVRDPIGFRGLWLGQTETARTWVVTSETSVLKRLGVQSVREVNPGQGISIGEHGIIDVSLLPLGRPLRSSNCSVEPLFMADDSAEWNRRLVGDIASNVGRQLALDYPVDAHYVVPITQKGVNIAKGYSQASGIPLLELFVALPARDKRSFLSSGSLRALSTYSCNPNIEKVGGKRIVLVAPALIRAAIVLIDLVHKLRSAGASEVHLRVALPPVRYPCFFGTALPQRRSELIAASETIMGIHDYTGVDSIGFLVFEQFLSALGLERSEACTACITGEYPIPVRLEPDEIWPRKTRDT